MEKKNEKRSKKGWAVFQARDSDYQYRHSWQQLHLIGIAYLLRLAGGVRLHKVREAEAVQVVQVEIFVHQLAVTQ